MSNTSGRGVFEPRSFSYVGLDGSSKTWSGRGRWPKDLQALVESEAAKGLSTVKDALVAHRKNKPTGRPVGRPAKVVVEAVAPAAVKAMADEIIARMPEA